MAFYDALEINDSAVKVLGEPALRAITQEFARLRVMIKLILRKHGYPPDKQERAVKLVLDQAEVLFELEGRT